uniref:Chondroitin proteoglycan 2 n=1 Tax=Toxocara canis TaxID=6265 RepID=A0A183U0G8_TOXCA
LLSGRMRPAYLLLLAAFVAWVESTPGYFDYGFHRRRDFPGDDFCLRRHDGHYAVGCVPQFVSCSGKVSHVMFCRDGLFFDGHLGKCVPKWHASSCRGHGHPRPHHGLIPSFTPVEPERSRFCKHRADGDYNIGCTSCYISCSGKHAFAKECPAGLVLDEASDTCVERSYVAVCGGVPTTTPETTTTTTPTTTTTLPPASEATTEPTTSLPLVKPCHRHNGFFAMGCSSRYFVCIDGLPSYRSCRYGFAFDEYKQICVPKCEVTKCGCRPRPTTTTTTEETTTTTEPASEETTPTPASEETTPAITTRYPAKPCRHHNGFFAIGCSSRYVSCIDGLPTYHTCQRGLTFDERRKTCLPKQLVKYCGIPESGE